MPRICKFFKVLPKVNYYICVSKKGVSTEINNCFYVFFLLHKLFPCVLFTSIFCFSFQRFTSIIMI